MVFGWFGRAWWFLSFHVPFVLCIAKCSFHLFFCFFLFTLFCLFVIIRFVSVFFSSFLARFSLHINNNLNKNKKEKENTHTHTQNQQNQEECLLLYIYSSGFLASMSARLHSFVFINPLLTCLSIYRDENKMSKGHRQKKKWGETIDTKTKCEDVKMGSVPTSTPLKNKGRTKKRLNGEKGSFFFFRYTYIYVCVCV